MKLEITVIADVDKEAGTSHVYIAFPKEQENMSITEASHLLTAGIAILIRACAKTDTGIKDYELMKEVREHLEEEFSTTRTTDTVFVNEKGFDKKEKK